MEDNLFNQNNNFNPEDHNIEMDEIAKLYAIADMKESRKAQLKTQAELFYKDFEALDIKTSVLTVVKLITKKELTLAGVNTMLDNMISVFQETEEYEKCHTCLQIKNGVNDKF
jgi:hypothetical protein